MQRGRKRRKGGTLRAVAGKRGGIVRVARGVANKQLLSLHVMRQKENSQRLKEKQTLKAKKRERKAKRVFH